MVDSTRNPYNNNLDGNLPLSPIKKKKKFRWLFITISILILIILLSTAAFFFSVYSGWLGHIPTREELLKIRNPIASEVYSAEGKLLGRYYLQNRSNTKFDEISPNVLNALIATEDARFYEHRGIDEIALLRVFVKTILMKDKSSGGGSTLSQQIAKNLFPRQDYGIISLPVNKLREAIIAYRLERIYTKEEILTLYLNTIPFAENVFGIEVAAERFFNKKPIELTVDEAAVLIGMLKANNSFNPRKNPERSKNRRNIVIDQMVQYKYLTEEEGYMYKQKPIEIRYYKISYNEGPAPYFLEMMKPELLRWCKNHLNERGTSYNLYTDGLQIKTTLNYTFQSYSQQAVSEYMKQLQTLFDEHWKDRKPWDDDPNILSRAIRHSERYKNMKVKGYQNSEIMDAFNKKTETYLLFPDGLKLVETTPLDSLKHYMQMLQAGFFVLNPHNGSVLAWIGGTDFRVFKYDHVNSPRQTGSTFKPFVYLAALEQGISPTKYFPNQRKVYKQYQNWSPRNSHDDYKGYYTMAGALAHSINTIAVDVAIQTGIDNIIKTVNDLGIEADFPRFPSIALGVTDLSLKQMVSGYAGILNGGKKVVPRYLVSISDSNGKLLEKFTYAGPDTSVISEENCNTLITLLQSVIDEGTGRGIRSKFNLPGEFAGKTGTTQNYSDGWFIGMNPELVAGCWVGADDPNIHFRTITYGQGAFMALPIVAGFFNKVYANPKYQAMASLEFSKPNEELLAELNSLDPYRELLKVSRKKEAANKISSYKKSEEELVKPTNKQTEEKPSLWKNIKDIFKKK